MSKPTIEKWDWDIGAGPLDDGIYRLRQEDKTIAYLYINEDGSLTVEGHICSVAVRPRAANSMEITFEQ